MQSRRRVPSEEQPWNRSRYSLLLRVDCKCVGGMAVVSASAAGKGIVIAGAGRHSIRAAAAGE